MLQFSNVCRRAAAAAVGAPGWIPRQHHLHGHAVRRGGEGEWLAGGRTTMVQVALEKMDDEYCHSALDYLEVEHASRLLRIYSRFLVVWLSDNRYAL